MNISANSIQDIFESKQISSFLIPSYQRAYSWEKGEQLSRFIEDLRDHPRFESEKDEKPYFMGHFLFESVGETSNEVYVIDGQQRLTTIYIFFHALLIELRSRFDNESSSEEGEALSNQTSTIQNVFFNTDARRKLYTVDYDDDSFLQLLNSEKTSTLQTKSAKRLRDAFNFFNKQVSQEKTSELLRWSTLLLNATISTFCVADKDQSTQIFAFQNNRGKPLTKLENLKAFLMHQTYVHSTRADESSNITHIEKTFSEIYKSAETIKSLDEDQVLTHHMRAFYGTSNDPVDILSKKLKGVQSGKSRSEFVRMFIRNLNKSFNTVCQIESTKHGQLKHETLISDILYLNAPSSWPLLIKLNHHHSEHLEDTATILKLVEVTQFKCQFMVGKSTDHMPNIAHKYDGDLNSLKEQLLDVSQNGYQHWWDFNGEIRAFLNGSRHYDSRSRYLLWKYENHLRSQSAGSAPMSYTEFINEAPGASLDQSIEHFMPQNPEGITHSEEFIDQHLNNLGNLVLMTRGRNSSLKNSLPLTKSKNLKNSLQLVSQLRIVNECLEAGEWGANQIESRKAKIVDFARNYWHIR